MLELAIDAAREAGEMLKDLAGKAQRIDRKAGEETNLVTELDRKSEAMIIGRIKARYPDHEVLAEESGRNSRESDYRWIIDPIDGTTNFAHGLPIFAVSIGIEHRGTIVAGVVYDPTRDEMFTTEKGRGAFLNGEAIHVSKTSRLIDSVLATGFPYDIKTNRGNVAHFENFLFEARALRRLGSAAIDLSYVACGRLDGYWELSLNPWDMAAGVLLVEEAGGRFTDLSGNPGSIYSKAVLTSNGLIHDQMVGVLQKGKVAGKHDRLVKGP